LQKVCAIVEAAITANANKPSQNIEPTDGGRA